MRKTFRALSNSKDGIVYVDGNGTVTKVQTTFPVMKDDIVQIDINDNGSALVIGVIGRGDEMQADINISKADIIILRSNQEYIALMTDVDIGDDIEDNSEYSKAAIIAKRNYKTGLGGINRINVLLEANKITQKDYIGIVGENATKLK